MEASVSEIVFRVVWILSSMGAILIGAIGLAGENGVSCENDYFPGIDPIVFVGALGFSAFPVINTGICLFFIIYFFGVVPGKKKEQAKRQEVISLYIASLHSAYDAYERLAHESTKK